MLLQFAPQTPLRRIRIWLALILVGALCLRVWSKGGDVALLAPATHRIPSATSSQPEPHPSLQKFPEPQHATDQNLCRAHGWRPFKTPRGGRPRKVYDLFMVGAELEWLEIRLNTTYDHVDHFIVVEAPLTFTGLPKPLVIKENWDRFAPYHDKLIYHQLEYPPDFKPPRAWDREDLQRDAMLLQVFPRLLADAENRPDRVPQEHDVLVVADVDEIVRPETLHVLRACAFPRRLTLRSRFHYYSFGLLHRGEEWPHPQATFYEGLTGTVSPVNLRNGDGGFQPWIYWDKADLWNAAWHCSYCYDSVERFLRKMASTSHREQNKAEFRDPKLIADRVREGKDIWLRKGEFYDPLYNNTDVPPLLLAERERFGFLLDRSGPSAGLKDYTPR